MDTLIRKSFAELQAANDRAFKALKDDRYTYEDRATKILATVQGRNRDYLKSAYISRWAIGIKKGSPTLGTHDTYVKAAQADIILDDRTELVDSGMLRTLSTKLGTLFTMDSQEWEYLTANGDPDEVTEKAIQANRDAGGYLDAVTRADVGSVAAGQCAVLLSWRDGIIYRACEPQHFATIYGPTITSAGEEYASDYTDLEDASVVIMRESMAATAADRSVYACWMGRTDEEPNGRYFRYYAGTSWLDVPARGHADIFYEDERGNPLTVSQNALGKDAIPHEYPFVVLHGARVEDINTIPADDVYWQNVDTSLGMSRCLTAGIIAARGSLVIQNPNSAPLPETLEGIAVLGDGQVAKDVSTGADNAKGGLDVVLSVCRLVLQQYGVPADELSTTGAPSVESGIAVLLKNAPLETARKFRAAINQTGVKRLFELERSLINVHGPGGIPWDTTQRWDCGSFMPPIDEEALASRQAMDIANKTLDRIGAIAEKYQITRAEAKKKAEEMDADAPPPPPPPTFGGINIPPRGPRGTRGTPVVDETKAPNEEQKA